MIDRVRHLVALAASTSSEHERRSAIEQAHRALSHPDVAIVSLEGLERLKRRVAAAEEESARAEEEIRELSERLASRGSRSRSRSGSPNPRTSGSPASEPLDVTLGRAAGDVAAKAARDVVGGVVRDLFGGGRRR